MKLRAIVLNLSLILSLAGAQSVQARFAYPETVKVPVQRLLSNLEKRLNSPESKLDANEKAELKFRIGRLHSMAYALKTSTVGILKSQVESLDHGVVNPFYGVTFGDFNQFSPQGTAGDAAAEAHLKAAIKNLTAAVKLNPALLQAKLGLAWCLDQSGEKSTALPLYREVFKSAYEREKNHGGLSGTSIASETAGYLEALLNPTKDAAEIASIKERVKIVDSNFRAITPIIVPLVPELTIKDMLRPASVSFDLDGNGPKHYLQWTGARAGWLVYDFSKSKQITSGLQLFGPSSFWIFWNDGYEAMKALDDNNDNQLSGTELNGLAVWSDTNGDGKSDAAEVRSVQELGITSLSCNGHLSADGTLGSINGVTFSDGRRADTYDLFLEQVK
ncbi:hypothetical protein BH10CYA1_BH10CYA1_42960 [soil metagenome]